MCVCAYLSVCRFFSMTNDNCRKFKQNQIIFCIRPWIVEVSMTFDFGEDRLRERGSLQMCIRDRKIYRAWQASIIQIINLWIWNSCMVLHTDILLPCSISKWKYGDGEKNRVRGKGWFWLYYPQNMKKSHFPKSVCV